MSQATQSIPNSSGYNFRQAVIAIANALASIYYGTTDPTTETGFTSAHQFWLDAANSLVKQLATNGTTWIPKGTLDVNGTIVWYPTFLNTPFSGDFHSQTTQGTFITSAAGQTNAPASGEPFWLYVNVDGSLILHLAVGMSTGNIYTECYNGSIWTAWSSLNLSGYLPLSGGTIAGNLTVDGTLTGNLTGTASRATADASGNTLTTTYAPLASPALTGTPTAPTANAGDSSTQIATTQFVTAAIGNINNNIASGRKITGTSGLDVTISSGTDVISNTIINRIGNTVTLPTRRACLIYDKSDGTSGYVGASFPAAVASTVYRWIVDGSSTVSSTVGSNNLVATGSITQTDGRCGYAALGAGGYYTAQNSTNIPAYSAAFAMRIKFQYISNGSAQTFYHDGVRKIGVGSTGYLTIAGTATTFMMNTGEEHLVEIFGAGSTTTGSIYVDGNLTVIGGAVAINATAVAPKVLANTSNGEISVSSVEYIELLNAVTDSPTAGHVANELLFPCFYTNSNVRYNVQEVLPSNTIAIAYAMAGSSTISLYNTDDYKYGRREKAVGGNRKVFLGWQSFTAGSTISWSNPFGTDKVLLVFNWAQDSNGTNETMCDWRFGDNGVEVRTFASGKNGIWQSISLLTGSSGVVVIGGSFQTSGYIGCYAEVLEDYKGVDGQ